MSRKNKTRKEPTIYGFTKQDIIVCPLLMEAIHSAALAELKGKKQIKILKRKPRK